MSELDDIADRVFDSFAGPGIGVCGNEIRCQIAGLLKFGCCESPIEAMLGVAIVQFFKYACHPCLNPVIICSQSEISGHNPFQKTLVYQYKFQKYRIDWALRDPPSLYFIECDGHDFHERTKEQAA
jgi:hypothetical protein